MSSREYVLQCPPGLERLLWQEARERDPGVGRVVSHVLRRRDALLVVRADDSEALRACRIADDIFAVLARGAVAHDSGGLARLEALASRLKGLNEALAEHAALHGGRGVAAMRTFRLVVRAAGDRDYRRHDVARRLEPLIGKQLGRAWRPEPDHAHVEIWITLLDAEAIIALRITGAEQRHRGKAAHLPGSLRPSAAAALARLSQPRDDDRVLDPFCGAGTILIERDHAGPHGVLTGSDISEEAIAAARENIGPRHQPLALRLWDATALPLEEGSVDVIITNPPFGVKVEAGDTRKLMVSFLQEAHRVLVAGGRIVLLTAAPREVMDRLTPPVWTAVRRHDFETQGRRVAAITAVRV